MRSPVLFGGVGHDGQRGARQSADLRHEALTDQHVLDDLQALLGRLAPFDQVANAQNDSPIGESITPATQTRKL